MYKPAIPEIMTVVCHIVSPLTMRREVSPRSSGYILDFRQLEIDLISFDKVPSFWGKDVVNFPHLEGKMFFQIPL